MLQWDASPLPPPEGDIVDFFFFHTPHFAVVGAFLQQLLTMKISA